MLKKNLLVNYVFEIIVTLNSLYNNIKYDRVSNEETM